MEKIKLLSFGEALIDFTPTSADCYRPNAGGAPFNLAVCTAKYGVPTAFIGKVGKDAFGALLINTAKKYGVLSDGFVFDKLHPTTHAFVTIDEQGERDFVFCRAHGADCTITKEEVDVRLVEQAAAFHFGGLSLTGGSVKSACLFALETAKRQGKLISFDPNYRALLWESEKAFCEEVTEVLPYVDILKVSDEEAMMITGTNSVEEALCKLEAVSLVALTMGAKGAVVQLGNSRRSVSGYKAATVDTTGAGDIFFGVFLSQILLSGKSFLDTDIDEAARYCDKACMYAAQSTEKHGAIPSIPNFSF